MTKEHGHGNRVGRRSLDRFPCDLRKVPAETVSYGESISQNGRTVYAAYDGERLICVAATAAEARRKAHDIRNAASRGGRSKS